jgi:hypothetical protein
MTTPLQRRRARLRQEYGFDFPDDFFRFWEFACRLRPLEPLRALDEPLGVVLVGPFEVLAGRFDDRQPRYRLLLHWRYYLDPPEFFTVLAGDSDGLHWGYYLDDPPAGPGCVAHYWARDAFDLSSSGDTLFEAVRQELEHRQRDLEDYQAEDARENPERAGDYDARLERIEDLREQLCRYATGDRPETGDEYAEIYGGMTARAEHVVAPTREYMGIVVPAELYLPLSLPDRQLRRYLQQTPDPIDVVEEARQSLRDGFPGTALKLGKELWPSTGAKAAYAIELLDAAYAALGREVLREVLRVHGANRDLRYVDILKMEEEEPGNGHESG